jgi:outer membrane protein assembly factor BamB
MRHVYSPRAIPTLLASVSIVVAAAVGMPASVAAGATPKAGQLKQLWAARYNGPQDVADEAVAVATSPDGNTVYVTGASPAPNTSNDYATIAYDATTGIQRWVARYSGPAIDIPYAIGVTPDGATVIVTGQSTGIGTGSDYATVAYEAATGAQRWVARYTQAGAATDFAWDLAVSPDGAMVFVTGESSGPGTSLDSLDFATVAYDTGTGNQEWASRYNGPANGLDWANSIGVGPDGATVFVTGSVTAQDGHADYGTIAYDAATGNELWVAQHDGPLHGSDQPWALAISPDGQTVFVTGQVSSDYGTIAYDAATGTELWVAQYDGPEDLSDTGYAIAVSPTGGIIFVTGSSEASPYETDYATVAYDSVTGAQRWVARFSRTDTYGNGKAISVSPDGAIVYVTGIMQITYTSGATLAYQAATGSQRAVKVSKVAFGNDLALSPDGTTLFVTGEVSAQGGGISADFATFAYRLTP